MNKEEKERLELCDVGNLANDLSEYHSIYTPLLSDGSKAKSTSSTLRV